MRTRALSTFCLFWCLGLLRTDRSQQTFVVRYRNGEQTIPVTVVLDYKKQTEYVINMSPRAATKTVTLYDFKQKTIAYKDLTNRECFLGRLTHETLSEETDALARIQAPVDHRPKVLSLDPRRPSLTPTEIRNVAGQKTAVFCAKMNTWLVLPGEAHGIRKREVDEIDERVFHRHGYHTVQYSHFGRETRRRYRIPSSGHSSQRRKDLSDWRAGDSAIAPANSALPPETPPPQRRFSSPSSLDAALGGNNLQIQPNVDPNDTPGPNRKAELQLAPTFHPSLFAANSNSGATLSPAAYSNALNGGGQQFPFYPVVTQIPNYQYETGGRIDNRKNFSTLEDTNAPNNVFENGSVSSASNSGAKNKMKRPFGRSPAQNPEKIESKYLEFPHYATKTESPDIKQNHAYYSNGNHRQSEEESIPSDYDLNTNRGKFYPQTFDEHFIPTDPDVSTNVLEIPKATKKFENIDSPPHLSPITQTDEDLHDVFESFLNLRNGHSPSEHVLYSSHFVPPEPSEGKARTGTEETAFNSYPSFPRSRSSNSTDANQRWGGNAFDITKPSDLTDRPSLTTNAYFSHNGVTAPPAYWNSNSDHQILKGNPDNSENVHPNPQKFIHSSRSWTGESSQPASSRNENTLSRAAEEYLTTRNPSPVSTDDERDSFRRSDIPSEGELAESVESFSPNSFSRNIPKSDERQDSFQTPVVREGASFQQTRLQNVLRNYKPDEIVIDLEKIPVPRPPESTLSFQGQIPSYNRDISPNSHRNGNELNSQQISGGIWRGRPVHKTNHLTRKPPNLQPKGLSFPSRNNYIPQHHRRNESNLHQHRAHDNNIRPFLHSSQHTLPHPSYTLRPYHRLGSLPPGVSIHPRHPNAPYADVVHSKVLPPAPQGRTPKSHRQRHRRKKGRACCRASGKTKSSASSCCGLSSHRGKPSTEHEQKQASAPQQVQKPADDPKNRCQKEKLCRTLYESTQQVMVCRNAKIDGC